MQSVNRDMTKRYDIYFISNILGIYRHIHIDIPFFPHPSTDSDSFGQITGIGSFQGEPAGTMVDTSPVQAGAPVSAIGVPE